jgi:hypothetical protein
MERVVIFHDQIIQFLRKELPRPEIFDGLVSQIELFTKHTLSEEDFVQICEGIIYSTSMFIEFFEQKIIQEMHHDLFKDDKTHGIKSEVKYWNEYWNLDLAKIKMKHLEVYHLKVSSVYATYGEIIKDICENVAKKITIEKDKQAKILNPSRKNSQRPESQHSKQSEKSKLSQEENLKEL